jgi:hypothetical protein
MKKQLEHEQVMENTNDKPDDVSSPLDPFFISENLNT